MKKILAILLAVVMSVTAFGFNVSAVEKKENTSAEIQQKKLDYILDLNDIVWVGTAIIYDGVWPSVMENAREVCDTDGLPEEEYTNALKQVYDMYYDAPLVNMEYAEATYKNALKEENYNNWYSEEEWNDFQEKLKELGDAIDYYHSHATEFPCDRLTKAFKELMTSYNKMTNAYTVKGDVNGDGDFNIEDATLVQKAVVNLTKLTGAQKMLTNEKNYENISVVTVTNLQKHVVGLEPEFKNNNVFIDEQSDVGSLDDTLRWYNYCNFNICPRRSNVTSGVYIDNDYICMDNIFGYRIWCDEMGYDYL